MVEQSEQRGKAGELGAQLIDQCGQPQPENQTETSSTPTYSSARA